MKSNTFASADKCGQAGKNRPGARMVTALLIGLSVALLAAGYGAFAASADKPPAERRAAAAKAQQQGNFRDALEGFSKLLLDPADDATEAPSDLSHAVECLQRLGRVDEIDDLREKAVATHGKNGRLLELGNRRSVRHFAASVLDLVAGEIPVGDLR
jgi:hypothetical protein